MDVQSHELRLVSPNKTSSPLVGEDEERGKGEGYFY
jgi:hypothetical protein